MRGISLIAVTAVLLLTTSAAQAQPVLNLPPRPADAPTGSQFYEQIRTLGENDREQRIINQIARGNVPDFMRSLVPVTAGGVIGGQNTSVTLHVTPDYLAIGSNADYFRMPMSAPLAQQVADLLECSLPTRKIVNDIYTAAAVKLAPAPFNPANFDIDSVEVFWLSNQAIQNQLSQGGHALGLLVGGTKKDVVVTAQLPLRPPPPRVAIYGWHQLNGQPIQPLSLVHEAGYEDYSHGIRLVWNQVATSAGTRTIPQMLADPTLHPLVSDEGSFNSSRYPIPNPLPITLSENLIQNGSFEDAFTNGVGAAWERWTAPGSATITFGRATVNRVDGAASQYWARTDTTPFDGGIRQRVAVEVGARYRLAARMKRQSTLAGTQMAVGYDPGGGADPLAGSVVYTTLMAAANDTWATYSADFTAAADSVVVFARGGHTGITGGTNSYSYVDAFSLFLLERASAEISNGWLVR